MFLNIETIRFIYSLAANALFATAAKINHHKALPMLVLLRVQTRWR
jgi:hypothetical protein